MPTPPSRGKPWAATDRTGGPLDDILDQLRVRRPDLIVERWDAEDPHTEDDNVYFLGDSSGLDRVQIDSAENGRPPFTVEPFYIGTCERPRVDTNDVAEAVAAAHSWLLN